MQVVKKTLIVLFVALLSLIVFSPKRELYYMLEEQLIKEDIIIHNEEIVDGLFTLRLNHPQIYFKGIRVAQIDSIEFWSILFYSKLSIGSIQLDEMLRRFISTKVDTLSLTHTISNPLELLIDGSGGFGTIDGYFLIKDRVVRVNIYDQKLISKLKPLLKKDDKGWYYETSI